MEDMAISQTDGPCSLFAQKAKVMGSDFNIDKRIVLIEPIGSGAYGTVVSAKDRITGKRYAIKKIEKVFKHPIYAKRTLREMKIVRLLDHENLLKFDTIQLPNSYDEF
jgi:serine/threonine protein kinase